MTRNPVELTMSEVEKIAGHIRYQESRMVAAETQLAQRIKMEMDPAITEQLKNQQVAG